MVDIGPAYIDVHAGGDGSEVLWRSAQAAVQVFWVWQRGLLPYRVRDKPGGGCHRRQTGVRTNAELDINNCYFQLLIILWKQWDIKTYLSICHKNFNLALIFWSIMIEHLYLACMILLTIPFNWHHVVTLTFLLQDLLYLFIIPYILIRHFKCKMMSHFWKYMCIMCSPRRLMVVYFFHHVYF